MSSQFLKSHIILYVKNQVLSTGFYSKLLNLKPTLMVPGMTEFQIGESCVLGLMPNEGIAHITAPQLPHPDLGTGIPRCEIYLLCSSIAPLMKSAETAGARLISEAQPRDWGETVVYFSDPDGHIIAFAEKTKIISKAD